GFAQQFLGQVGGGHLAGRVADVEPGQHACEGDRVETLMAGQQPATDPIQRIGLSAAMVGGDLLDPATHLIEGGVGEANHVEVVDYQPGVGQGAGHGGGVRLVGVDHDVADPGSPPCRLGCQPVADGGGTASGQDVDETAGVEVDDP